MKPYEPIAPKGAHKMSSPEVPVVAAADRSPVWNGKPASKSDTPQPPPVWTRYIDSRLKQFCVR